MAVGERLDRAVAEQPPNATMAPMASSRDAAAEGDRTRREQVRLGHRTGIKRERTSECRWGRCKAEKRSRCPASASFSNAADGVPPPEERREALLIGALAFGPALCCLLGARGARPSPASWAFPPPASSARLPKHPPSSCATFGTFGLVPEPDSERRVEIEKR